MDRTVTVKEQEIGQDRKINSWENARICFSVSSDQIKRFQLLFFYCAYTPSLDIIQTIEPLFLAVFQFYLRHNDLQAYTLHYTVQSYYMLSLRLSKNPSHPSTLQYSKWLQLAFVLMCSAVFFRASVRIFNSCDVQY